MRAVLVLSIILIGGPSEAGLSLNDSRGFINGKCYENVASASCRQDKICELVIFPQMRGQLAFPADGVTQDMRSSIPPFFRVVFRVQKGRAKVLQTEKVDTDLALKELQQTDYLGHAVQCPR